MFSEPDVWLYFFRLGFLAFTMLSTALGLILLVFIVLTVMRMAVSRLYGLAAVIESAKELQRQGKAPRLTRWLNYNRRHGIDS